MSETVYRLVLLPGDGIGPEVVQAGRRLIEAVAGALGHEVIFEEHAIGGAAIEAFGEPLPEGTLKAAREADAVLLGAVGGPKWDRLGGDRRPEAGLLGIRKALGVYANLRPVRAYTPLLGASPLRREKVEGVDLLIVRELTGGLYFGPKRREPIDGGTRVVDELVYTTAEIERIVRLGFDAARKAGKALTSVDKANVLESSRHWREVVERVATDYPDVPFGHMLVDNCAMQLVRSPNQFGVIVTENMFGDILSDEAAVLTGSIGMLPSASLGDGPGLYEPVHGSAPDIAGQGLANPLGTMLSVGLMYRFSLNEPRADQAIVRAVDRVLEEGYRTADLAGPGDRISRTEEITEAVLERLELE
ncbi:3-isopropylmalate dehydrogenase [Kyrpidia spormannii]|uniref:3-isopropylmalate dehydrogenase n=1 Tax=Kyrpidia spormannii TaxID=2055160 RepID=A0ACA8ZBB5_9BACL|nr:3-isopropylmalate dehydrogenase [Kyrpidia spormannii]CAB3393657.1 3-isopropylmalate dehydrogenase [Kyrpidia spormannii]